MDWDTSDLIGLPFAWRGRGPHEYDCYGLLVECYRRFRRITVNDMDTATNLAAVACQTAAVLNTPSSRWKSTRQRPGVAVLFYIRGFASHIGFVLPGEKFIHTWEHSGGVTIERMGLWQKKIVGFYDYSAD